LGIGIGAPTANYFTGNIEYAPNLIWRGIVPLQASVNKATGLPVKVTNDANAVAHAELRFGYGKKFKHFAVLTLGTGLGSGIVVNGRVLYGAHGIAGEFGHTQLDPNGRLCSCGRRGCIEAYVSIRGIKQTFAQFGGSADLSPRQIGELAEKGDWTALKTYEQTGRWLGMQMADLVHLFDLEAIIFYGGIAFAHRFFLPYALQELNNNLLPNFKNKVQLLVSQLLAQGQGGILGAAALIWDELTQNE
jgi:glucokinase